MKSLSVILEKTTFAKIRMGFTASIGDTQLSCHVKQEESNTFSVSFKPKIAQIHQMNAGNKLGLYEKARR